MSDPLTAAQRDAALGGLPDWCYDPVRRALYRGIALADFAEALSLIVRIGVVADHMDHHPDWTNVHRHLDIWLTTHDAGDVSDRDIALARAIDAIAPSTMKTIAASRR